VDEVMPGLSDGSLEPQMGWERWIRTNRDLLGPEGGVASAFVP